MQRISVKAAVGMARSIEGGVKQPPVLQQLARIDAERLSRIRYGFEIERQIAEKLAAGDNVGLLRERLQGVRNGSIQAPKDFGRKQDAPRSLVRPPERNNPHQRVSRLYRGRRELEVDLLDLAKGKLTMTGIATVKGLLDRFEDSIVIEALGLANGLVEKVRSSAVFNLAPPMSPDDGMLLVEALEWRMRSPNS